VPASVQVNIEQFAYAPRSLTIAPGTFIMVRVNQVLSSEHNQPGDPFTAWDMQVTGDFMPRPFATFRVEYNYRHANVPYFSGRGGVTPPGGNAGPPGSAVEGFTPDLRKSESRLTFAFLVKL
jgi:hypothetical protein